MEILRYFVVINLICKMTGLFKVIDIKSIKYALKNKCFISF